MNGKIKEAIIKLVLFACFACISFTLSSQEEEEQALSGRELLTDCEGTTQPTQACMKYVFGLVQTVVMLQQMEPGQQLFCINPTEVSLETVTNKVTAFLEDSPERLGEDAYVLVSEALNTHYPCPMQDVI
ncbi:MAG: hypothetical protein GKR93_15920 [Gammaproteobacteria bacterium]|nr:hypothetical protein [Gammaproteobacteria bacterium]